jgi:hypothetical protein
MYFNVLVDILTGFATVDSSLSSLECVNIASDRVYGRSFLCVVMKNDGKVCSLLVSYYSHGHRAAVLRHIVFLYYQPANICRRPICDFPMPCSDPFQIYIPSISKLHTNYLGIVWAKTVGSSEPKSVVVSSNGSSQCQKVICEAVHRLSAPPIFLVLSGFSEKKIIQILLSKLGVQIELKYHCHDNTDYDWVTI